MANYIEISGLRIDEQLYRLVCDEIIPGTGVEAGSFWASFETIVTDLAPKNRALLNKRDELQRQIDAWCIAHRGEPFDLG
jgi:malate synthase